MALQTANSEWWRGCVIYQIYPRSFMDTNGDGVGDLKGIEQKLDYVASLGVDAIWISPINKSPMKDYGYDVSDYCDIDPLFGSLADFDSLLASAHKRGLKVLIDFVPSHTSDEHAWFKESRSSRTNPKADWYVWADANHDGTPPNNWLSVFGGSSWQWDTRRNQYYLHNFLTSQPDLNWHNPEVVEAMLGQMKFWLDRGIDGFRLDAVNFTLHDRKLRNNPACPDEIIIDGADKDSNPYAWQLHIFDKTQPGMIGIFEKMRKLVNQYPGAALIAEVGSDDSMATAMEYTAGNDRLHMAYAFALLGKIKDTKYIEKVISRSVSLEGGRGWPTWSLSNHDVERIRTRWGTNKNGSDAQVRQFLALEATLRGSLCLYQGEELGLPEVDVPFERLRDPVGITFWPEGKGRDGCRTPMPWSSADKYFGFSSVEPWLPADDVHRPLAVDQQEGREDSMLAYTRKFLAFRKAHAALMTGSITFQDRPEGILSFVREKENDAFLCVFNFSSGEIREMLDGKWTPLDHPGRGKAAIVDGVLVVPKEEFVILSRN